MNLRILALLAFCLCLSHGRRASGAESSALLDIEPTREHPRNSEGSFATLKSGRLIFANRAGDAKIGGLNRLRIRRISLDWLPAQ